jgi:glycosyltransferase EpsF
MPIRVLQFFSTLNNGGAENRMMDAYRCIDPNIVTFDFAVLHEGNHYFDEEVKAMGSEKYVLPDPRAGLVRNYLALIRFFREHPFQAVHTHVSWYGGVVLMAAKRAGIKNRIAHARTAAIPNQGLKDKLICNLGKVLIAMSATRRMAISEEAAAYIFGKRVAAKGKYQLIPNAIDQKKYVALEGAERAKLRDSLGIPAEKKAYVTVANFRKPKNHLFLLDVAKALKEKGDNYILYLIGDGDLRAEIENKVRTLGLEDQIVLMGVRGDVPQILCAFDGMIFPSIYEGLGGVVLEAQLVGVPAVVSDAIPKIADIGIGMVDFVPLSAAPEKWAEAVMAKHVAWDRQVTWNAFEKAGYCIEETTRKYLREYGISEEMILKAIKIQ